MIALNDIEIRCLLDTGAQVSTITESFYRRHASILGNFVDITNILRVSAANGGNIPYIGYIECDLRALEHTFKDMGFLIVKDPDDNTLKQRKRKVPGVIGSNIFRGMRDVCSSIKKLPEKWGHILTLYEEMNATEISYKSNIRIPNDQTVIIPAGTIKMIEAQARPAPKGHVLDCIVEENTTLTMPNGFQLASAVVSVRQDGRIPVQICNYSNTNIKLKPKTMIGCAMTQNDSAHDKETAEVNSQTVLVCPVTNNDYLGKMDVGSLTSEQQLQLKDVISKYSDTLSKGEDDIGFFELQTAVLNEHRVDEEQPDVSLLRCPPLIASSLPTFDPVEMAELQKADPTIKRLMLYLNGDQTATKRQFARETKEV
ncbi:Hypothetical predicted protein [Mytilus galloprovincialis]|uniref:Peptidase A2 domain-containing protein n=1 Tax=Mytilus galloprovincialis TaxID=29158 RepID=A0A8B6GPC4_MYTGA|nr:Hypothetical predicted protein [Mytilus galloprovincialis]